MSDILASEIESYVDAHWGEVLADIESLVAIESVEDLDAAVPGAPYGPGPRKALDQVLSIAGRMGLDVHDCEGHIGYADLPGASETQVGIIGHVDVVPAGPGWSFEPYALTRKDGYLLGRGVIDDKGPLTVALHAVKFWADRAGELPYTVRVLFGANEETNMKDVAYYRAHYADPAFLFTPDSQFPVGYGESGICSGVLESAPIVDGALVALEGGVAVNAVPGVAQAVVSEAAAARAGLPGAAGGQAGDACGAGRIEVAPCAQGVVVKAHGQSAHASTPELGVNAIDVLAQQLLSSGALTEGEQRFFELVRKVTSCYDGSGLDIRCWDAHFGDLTAVGGMISLDEGRIRLTIDFRYPTPVSAGELEERVQACAAEAGASFEMLHDKEPFLMDPDSPAVRALLDAYNQATGEDRQGVTSKGGTYARCFTTGVSFGPEKPWEETPEWVGAMHGPDEGVSEALLKQALSIYIRTIGNLMQLDLGGSDAAHAG